MSRMVPGYLQFSLELLSREQDHFRKKFADAWGGAGLEALQEQARHNLEVFEKAMTMWSPYRIAEAAAKSQASAEAATTSGTDQEDTPSAPKAGGEAADAIAKPASKAPKAAAAPPAEAKKGSEIDALKAELEAMQRRIERLSQNDS